MHRSRAAMTRCRVVASLAQALAILALTAVSACGADQAGEAATTAATTTTTIPFADFVEMYFYLPDDRQTDAMDRANDVVHGIVETDGTCLYIHQLETWGGGGLYRDSSGAVHTYLLALPYTLTRYDPQTQTLWYGQNGPIANGDKATAFGWLHEPDRPSEACPLAGGRKLSGELVPGLAEILCRPDGVGISGVVPGAEEYQPCV